MKKIYTLLFATAVAALAMVSCQKNIQEENIIENETPESSIHFYAEEIATKTTFGALADGKYPTLWTDTKGIKISYNKKTSVEATVTPKDGNTKADFTPASSFSDDGSGAHVFYAMSPSSAQGANISTSYYSWRFLIPDTQTPLDGSVDEGAQILYAKYDAGDTFPTAVPFSFSHVTAYGKLSFASLALDGDEDVTSITLTASKDWVGQWFYQIAAKDTYSEGDFRARDGYVSKKLTLNTDKTSDIWFACAPVDLSNGGTIDINVFTTKGVFTKKVTFPEGKGNFTAGHIGTFTVNMSGIVRSAMVDNIVAIRNLYTSANVPFVANLTNALVTIVSGDNFYMQDATGGIYVYTAGHEMSVGDKLNGVISGTVTNYYGIKEIIGFDSSATKTTGNEVTPATVAHATLVDNFADYESEYVKVEGLTVSAVSGKDITVSDNANLKIRNESGATITVGTQMNAVGAAVLYNTTKQVKIYTLADADVIKIGSVITASDKAVDVGSTVSIGATTNSTATITYESANTSVATVNASGVISGVTAGSTTITCSVAASGKYLAASKVINVTVSAGSSNTWARVTTVDQITSGGTFIIGYEKTANSGIIVPMRQEGTATVGGNGYIRSGDTAGSSNSNTLTMAASMSASSTAAYETVIEAVPSSGTIAIKIGSNYIIDACSYGTKWSNNVSLSTTKVDESGFTPTIGDNDVVTLTSTRTVNSTHPVFQYNTSNPRFCSYGNAAQKNLVLYKKN